LTGETSSYTNWDQHYKEPEAGYYMASIMSQYYHPNKHLGEWVGTLDTVTDRFYGHMNAGFILEKDFIEGTSAWVLASEAPADAKIVSEKWTYDEKEVLTSTQADLEGYTLESSEWKESDSGSFYYASFPSAYDTSNTYYKSYKKSAYTASETESTKRVVSTSRSGYIFWHWAFKHSYGEGDFLIGDYKNELLSTGYYTDTFEAFVSNSAGTANPNYTGVYQYTGKSSYSYWWKRIDRNLCNYTDYVKQYTYSRIVPKESLSEVIEANNISNVQHWVQYSVIE